MKNFVAIINGEAVGNITLPEIESTERMIAILGSNPTIVASIERIEEGSTWDGLTFTPPVV